MSPKAVYVAGANGAIFDCSSDDKPSLLVLKNGWRYTRYADDMTLSFPVKSKKAPATGKMAGLIKRIVADEGFLINPSKTRFVRPAGCQRVTGLVVNDDQPPRVPRIVKRRIRAAIHNLSQGKELKNGDTPQTLIGYAAYIHMSEPELGRKLLDALRKIDREVS